MGTMPLKDGDEAAEGRRGALLRKPMQCRSALFVFLVQLVVLDRVDLGEGLDACVLAAGLLARAVAASARGFPPARLAGP